MHPHRPLHPRMKKYGTVVESTAGVCPHDPPLGKPRPLKEGSPKNPPAPLQLLSAGMAYLELTKHNSRCPSMLWT